MNSIRPLIPSYRPDIDGLRAVAVLLVLAFHFFPTYWAGGYLGVDVFFVISGFLITGIIWDQLERGNFSLGEFYLRRIRRLFPSLLVVLAATSLVAYWMFIPFEHEEFGSTLEAAAAFVPNLYFWRHTGYFDVNVNKQPLVHLWSLGVEEQFYLAWPLLLLTLRRLRVSPIPVVLALGALSLAYAASRPDGIQDHAFYLPQFHAWELAVGCALGLLAREDMRRSWAEFFSWIGLCFVATAVVWSGFYGAALSAVFFTVAGTGLLILGGPATIPNRVLGSGLAAALGRRSYSLYLWHWPLLCIALILSTHKLVSSSERWILLAACFLCAEATYVYVERPLRGWRLSISLPLVAASVAMLVMGSLMSTGTFRPRSAAYPILRILERPNSGTVKCARDRLRENTNVCELTLGKSEVLFWGDSNSIQYAPRAEKLVQENFQRARAVSFVNGPGCPPIPDIVPSHFSGCKPGEDYMVEMAVHPEVKTIVLAAQWVNYMEGKADALLKPSGSDLDEKKMLLSMENIIRTWRGLGKDVVVILSSPAWPPGPQVLLARHFLAPWNIEGTTFPRAQWDEKRRAVMNAVRRHAEAAGARIIDPTPFLCDENSCAAIAPDGLPIYADSNHLSDSYVRDHVRYIDDLIVPARAGGEPSARSAFRSLDSSVQEPVGSMAGASKMSPVKIPVVK